MSNETENDLVPCEMGHGCHSKEIFWERGVGGDAAHYIHDYRKLIQQRAVIVTPCQVSGYERVTRLCRGNVRYRASSTTYVKEKIFTNAPLFDLPRVNLQVT